MLDSLPCPLCGATHSIAYHCDRQRNYRQCPACKLVFVPPAEYLPPGAEKAHYDQHENDPGDHEYRHFLSRLAQPLLAQLIPGSKGLDYGCGPGPALAAMLTEAGMQVSLYDVFYAPNEYVWRQQYDFITCTEVLEHLYQPGTELERLFGVLKTGGWLGIMTKRVRNQDAFANWHYIRDPTHVCFYSETTLAWIATRWNARLILPAADVALFQKHCPAP